LSTCDRSVWAVADGIATVLMRAAMTARARMLAHASPLVRLMGQRDAIHHDASLLERELAIFRSQRQRKPAHQRPHYSPSERAQILEVMKLRGWSVKETSQRFVVHPNTIRNWLHSVEDKVRARHVLGAPPWNRLHDGVRRLVHEIRETFPEPEFGTRTIARHIIRAGIQVSRTTVRRVLQEEPLEPRNRFERRQQVTRAPKHVQHPMEPNKVWHLDITTYRMLWMKIEIAAIVDGFTRKIIALQAFSRRPTSRDLFVVVNNAVSAQTTTPGYIVTDHGSQFRRRFRRELGSLGITHVRCRVHTWQLNAKVERVFRDVKGWLRRSTPVLGVDALQARLDAYRIWHNSFRPHAAHGSLTPEESEDGALLQRPGRYTQRGGTEPIIKLERRCVRGDPRLCYPVISVAERRSDAA